MKKILLILSVIVMGSCSRAVFVEREPNVLVERYKTFSWNKLEVTTSKSPFYNSVELNDKIMASIEKELMDKGILKVNTIPDFLVDFHIYVEEGKYQQEYCPAGYYREGRYSPDLRNWPYCESPAIRTFDDGTLLIDIVDAKTQQLVWRGSAGTIIDFTENIPKIFTKKVHKVMKKFPANTTIKIKETTIERPVNKKSQELVKS